LTEYFLSALIGYAFGSFPTAYLLVKWKRNLDIRQVGSGNVGTMNVFDVTGSAALGVVVLIIDILKGMLPVLLVLTVFTKRFELLATAGLSAIIGHGFPVWLGLKGGRGLATTAGVMFVIGWVFIVIWIILWAGSYLPTKNIHAANILASIVTPALIAVLPASMLEHTLPHYTSATNLLFFGIAFCAIILMTHRESILLFMKKHH